MKNVKVTGGARFIEAFFSALRAETDMIASEGQYGWE